jgi:2-methylisocitrate lyase-like PEP mutase family enzyme
VNTSSLTQTDSTVTFRALCDQRSLVLPNAWDAASAVCAARAGAPAIATTSAGVAWAHGVPDGGGLRREQALQSLADIARVTNLPVTADIEYGYEEEDSKLADFIKEVLDLGVVGVNIEDSDAGGLVGAAHQARRITVIRIAADSFGVDLFINARVDTAFFGPTDTTQRDIECLSRAASYIDAGADGIFIPGISDAPTVTNLAGALSVPLNVMVGPGSPSVRALLDAGAGRITTGMAGALAAYAQIESAAHELLQHGTYDSLSPAQDFGQFNASMR